MELLLIGASHRTASVDVRGQMARAAARYAEWYVRHSPKVVELFVVLTCHRVEIVGLAGDPDRAEHALVDGLLEGTAAREALYVHRGEAAVRHLARVASGLDSLIVGEAEVSGQIRRAVASAREAGTIGPVLGRVASQCLRASGRARSATHIGQGTVSAAGAAVSLLEDAWGSFEGHSVLVVGAGEAACQALHRLRRRGASRLVVASRSAHHARQAAERYGARAIDIGAIADELSRVDGIITATRAPGTLIDGAMLGAREVGVGPLQIVDLSVPRIVDAGVARLASIALHTVDDLGDVVRESLARRVREIPRVERMLAEAATETYRQFAARRDGLRRAVA